MTNESYSNWDHFDVNSCAEVEGIILNDFSLMYIKSYSKKAAERGKCNISNYDIS